MCAKQRRQLAIVSFAAILALTGCGSTADEAPTNPAASAAPTESSPSQDGQHLHDEEDDHPSEPVPEAAEESQSEALTAAVNAVTTFARPSLDETQWWNDLLPLLSQKGAVAYEGTLPSNIPVTAVTGPASILEASTEYATLVEVPTDAGPYIVTLVRGSADEPWLAERIRPAGQ